MIISPLYQEKANYFDKLFAFSAIIDEEWEEIEDDKLKIKLIEFCIRHFDDYKPCIKVY